MGIAPEQPGDGWCPLRQSERVYRVMREHQLVLHRPGARNNNRRHDGRVAVDHSNALLCWDGFEFGCNDVFVGSRV